MISTPIFDELVAGSGIDLPEPADQPEPTGQTNPVEETAQAEEPSTEAPAEPADQAE